MTPLNPEDCIPPDLPEDTAGIVNLLIEAVKLGGFRYHAEAIRLKKWEGLFEPFSRDVLHELDQICHRLGVASGTPSWYWLELVMSRPTLQCQEATCTQPATDGRWCDDHTF